MAAIRPSSDVLVVGAGIVGLSIALALQERGAHVVVVERAGVAEGHCRLALGVTPLAWSRTTAEERLEAPVPLAFASCGYLFLAHSEPVLERLAAAVRVQNAAGVPSRLVSPVEAGKLVPGLETTSLAGGSYCAEHGYMVSRGQRSRRSPGSSTSAARRSRRSSPPRAPGRSRRPRPASPRGRW